jgi:quinol monooxygenase YgiN
MVRLRVALRPMPAQGAQGLVEDLRFIALGTRSQPGCLGSSAWVDPDSTVQYVEEWTTEAEMRRRVMSRQFTSLLAIVEAARDPKVQFDFVSETRGLDYAAEVRGETLSSGHAIDRQDRES